MKTMIFRLVINILLFSVVLSTVGCDDEDTGIDISGEWQFESAITIGGYSYDNSLGEQVTIPYASIESGNYSITLRQDGIWGQSSGSREKIRSIDFGDKLVQNSEHVTMIPSSVSNITVRWSLESGIYTIYTQNPLTFEPLQIEYKVVELTDSTFRYESSEQADVSVLVLSVLVFNYDLSSCIDVDSVYLESTTAYKFVR